MSSGDDPPRDRTSELRVLGFPGRHLGPIQMTTDTALGVTKIVVQDKSGLLPMSSLPLSLTASLSQYHFRRFRSWYVDILAVLLRDHALTDWSSRTSRPSFSMRKKAWRCHSVSIAHGASIRFLIVRFTGYIVKDGEPLLPPGMHEHLKEDLDKSFDF